MEQKPRFENLEPIVLVGVCMEMTVQNNRTQELWQSFMPRRNEISARKGNEYFSVEVYPDLSYFKSFDSKRAFQKWAAVAVNELEDIPLGMKSLTLSGHYAVFTYRGRADQAAGFYQILYGQWIPSSPYELDHRPHFAVMGEKYKPHDENSEEEIYIPIVRRD